MPTVRPHVSEATAASGLQPLVNNTSCAASNQSTNRNVMFRQSLLRIEIPNELDQSVRRCAWIGSDAVRPACNHRLTGLCFDLDQLFDWKRLAMRRIFRLGIDPDDLPLIVFTIRACWPGENVWCAILSDSIYSSTLQARHIAIRKNRENRCVFNWLFSLLAVVGYWSRWRPDGMDVVQRLVVDWVNLSISQCHQSLPHGLRHEDIVGVSVEVVRSFAKYSIESDSVSGADEEDCWALPMSPNDGYSFDEPAACHSGLLLFERDACAMDPRRNATCYRMQSQEVSNELWMEVSVGKATRDDVGRWWNKEEWSSLRDGHVSEYREDFVVIDEHCPGLVVWSPWRNSTVDVPSTECSVSSEQNDDGH